MSIAWELIKRLGPYLFVAAVCAGLITYGWTIRDNDFQEYITQQKIESQKLVDQAEARNEQYKKSMAEAARIISDTYAANVSSNALLNRSNNTLLSERLRYESNLCSNGMPETNSATSGGNNTSTQSKSFLEESGKSLIDSATEADRINESLRACQEYVKSIPNEFFEGE